MKRLALTVLALALAGLPVSAGDNIIFSHSLGDRAIIGAGDAFPTNPQPHEGMLFQRLDLDQLYVYSNATWTLVSFDGTANNTFSGDNLFSGRMYIGTAATAAAADLFSWRTAQTVDTAVLALNTTSRNLLIVESGDEDFDFAHAQQTNPTLYIHSAAQSTNQWIGFGHNGTNGFIEAGIGNIHLTGVAQSIVLGASGAIIGTTETFYGTFYPQLPGHTPDSGVLGTGNISNSIHFHETADVGNNFDNGACGTTACGDPNFIVHSRNVSTTQYISLSSQNATGMGEVRTNLGSAQLGGSKLNITEAAAQEVALFNIAAGEFFSATVFYLVSDSDGTDHIARGGNIVIQGVNKSGTETCTIAAGRDQETEDGSSVAQTAALTLTYTWTVVNTVGSNNCALQINGASNAGVNTFDVVYNIQLTANANAVTVTPQ